MSALCVAVLGPGSIGGARTAKPADAVAQADAVLLSPRLEHLEAVIDAAETLADRIVLDTTNQ